MHVYNSKIFPGVHLLKVQGKGRKRDGGEGKRGREKWETSSSNCGYTTVTVPFHFPVVPSADKILATDLCCTLFDEYIQCLLPLICYHLIDFKHVL
jgi:hypothetical protein